jgi:hypothetical protein
MDISRTEKDNFMKYTAFCGGKKPEIVQHVSKNSVIMCVVYIYKILLPVGSSMPVLHNAAEWLGVNARTNTQKNKEINTMNRSSSGSMADLGVTVKANKKHKLHHNIFKSRS